MNAWTYPAIAAGIAANVLTFGAAHDAQRRGDSMWPAAVDRKLQLIMDHHHGITEPDQYLPKVTAHSPQDRKAQTVKTYRDAIGTDPAGTNEAAERTAHDRDL
jgi:hypothetical protein